MKTHIIIIALALVALLSSCAQPNTTTDCTCSFNGKSYVIKQNTRGAVYGVPVK